MSLCYSCAKIKSFLIGLAKQMEEARKSASGMKQNHEKGGIHVLEMGNRYDISYAHVCVGSGWEGEILSRVLPKMSLSSNVQMSSANMVVYNVHSVF